MPYAKKRKIEAEAVVTRHYCPSETAPCQLKTLALIMESKAHEHVMKTKRETGVMSDACRLVSLQLEQRDHG
jgi:hypothetical protein